MEFVIFAVCAVYCTALTLWTRRELKQQRMAAAQARKNLATGMKEYTALQVKEAEKRLKESRGGELKTIREDVEKLATAVSNLEQGIVPDFEEAKKAAKAVNDFNTGISAIMGYDPMEARRKMREGRKGETE